jgi:ABC-type transport system involved in multi-copper enzyme maturation permease subunit
MPIFDQGYQHWQGALSGHGWRWLTIARHGARAGMQNRWVRIVLLFAWLPALALVAVLCLWGMAERQTSWAVGTLATLLPAPELLRDPVAFRLTLWALAFRIFFQVEIYFVMILVMMIGPGLISQDLRFNALPLYFSRPVRRVDYFVGKLGIIAYFLGLVTIVPAVAAWLLGGLFSLDFTVFLATAHILLGVVVYGLVVALSAGLLMLALSSLSRNSRYVGAFWAGFWLFTLIVSGILRGIHVGDYYREHFRRQQEITGSATIYFREPPQPDRDVPDRERLKRAEREQARRAELRKARQQVDEEIGPSFRRDWRPLVAYSENLLRIGDALLGAYDALDRFDALLEGARTGPSGGRRARYAEDDFYIPRPPASRWPWYWSGLVLLALGGLSLWILTPRVKTLDRLR